MQSPNVLPESPTHRRRRPFTGRRLAVAALTPLLLLSAAVGALNWLKPTAAQGPAPQVREFTLTAEELEWEIMPGTTVRAWGYNGQVPGPEIRVREGDTVRITLRNRLPVGTTVHWHGIDNTPAMDGPAGLNQAPVEPGQDFTYEFVADPAGSRMYHSHTDVATQVALGLYGPMIVEPREPGRTYDREYTYMLAEWDMEMTPDVATGRAPLGPRDSQLRGGELGADMFLFNGKAHEAIAPIRVAEGERALIRVMNMGNMPHPIHTHGHSFKIVATDGNPVPEAAQLTKDTVLVGPGERYDLELTADNPGVWMFHCHIEAHGANGMMSLIEYEGAVPTGPLAVGWVPSDAPVKSGGSAPIHQHGPTGSQAPAATPAAPTPTASAFVPPVPTETPAQAPAQPPAQEPAQPPAQAPVGDTPTGEGPVGQAPAAGGATVEVAMRDDRFDAPTIEVAAGTTVVWTNEGAHYHSVAGMGGSFVSQTLGAGESFAHTFAEPGTYRYVCKQHGRQGMLGTITVT